MIEKEYHAWLYPTIAGMLVSILRRFRRNRNERFLVVFTRFLSHVATCVIAGYIADGVLRYLGYPSLIAPVCALSGLYGTLLVDWVEESGFGLLTAFLKSKLDK